MPSTGSGTGSSSKYKAVIELVEITERMSENVPSTGSGTESNTVIERSRNHLRNKITSENQQLHDDLVKLVEQMLKAKKEEQNAQSDHEKNLYENLTESLDYKINNLVYKLYNLTPEEIDLVENS